MDKEKCEQLKAFIAGTGLAPELEDELFFEDENALCYIDVCYTKEIKSDKAEVKNSNQEGGKDNEKMYFFCHL